jgi:hypothetical protein
VPDLIDEFDAALASMVTDRRFRRWGGLVLTSCLLGRHVWTSIREDQPLYPHLFVMLVANSGFGKSTTIEAVRSALGDYTRQPPNATNRPPVSLAATSITLPRMVREIGHLFPDAGGAKGQMVTGMRSRCYAVLADEVGILLGDKAGTTDLQTLADIWDMKTILAKQNVYGEMKGKETKARDHYAVLAAGAQPAWIAEAMPLGRFQLGFPARCHFVLGTARTVPTFSRSKGGNWSDALRQALGSTMAAVAAQSGEIGWSDAAWGMFAAWGTTALGQHAQWTGLLEGYGARRPEHAAKLALLVACARVHAQIELDDWNRALEILLDTEKHLVEVLAMVGANTQRPREDQVVEWVRARGETRETALRAYMRNFFETRLIGPTLEELNRAGLLVEVDPPRFSPHRKFVAP